MKISHLVSFNQLKAAVFKNPIYRQSVMEYAIEQGMDRDSNINDALNYVDRIIDTAESEGYSESDIVREIEMVAENKISIAQLSDIVREIEIDR